MIRLVSVFMLFILATGCPPSISSSTEVIVVPLGDVPHEVCDSIKSSLKIYGFNAQTIKASNLPNNALINLKTPRYRADTLLKYLNEIRLSEQADFAFGITQVDISTTKRDENGHVITPNSTYYDWGIFGLGYRPGRASIVSTFRLKNDENKFFKRLRKISIHEFGHNLGLKHCSDKNCVMNDAAESIKTIDNCSDKLCEACAASVF